jgi:hypothetical protein
MILTVTDSIPIYSITITLNFTSDTTQPLNIYYPTPTTHLNAGEKITILWTTTLPPT